ncbi:hypothetical protein [Jannaschia sp. R86511]|uniref:hypothetical protein n=1 Tax=Jannaschia sp. R86511 TaxID=3093853 RepID=UPI0036D3BAC9
MTDPFSAARAGRRLPDVVTVPAVLGRSMSGALAAVVLLLAASLTLALVTGSGEAWFAVAVAAALAVAVGALLLGRGPLVLSREGVSARTLGRRRTYAWQDVIGVRPTVVGATQMVAVDLHGGTTPRQTLLETYGRTPTELCELLAAYRAQALADDAGP